MIVQFHLRKAKARPIRIYDPNELTLPAGTCLSGLQRSAFQPWWPKAPSGRGRHRRPWFHRRFAVHFPTQNAQSSLRIHTAPFSPHEPALTSAECLYLDKKSV